LVDRAALLRGLKQKSEPDLIGLHSQADIVGALTEIAGRCCLFVDVDGTLVEFAERPEWVIMPPELIALIQRLSHALGGALALVSGRTLHDLDRLFMPLRLPAAGSHGLERRDAQGGISRCPLDASVMAAMRREMRAIAALYPGTFLEAKEVSIALHYRARPEIGAALVRHVQGLIRQLGPGLEVQEGACVCEIKPRSANKRTAIEAFLSEPPFVGRRPIFVGDDLTDHEALLAIDRHAGIAIAVGERVHSTWSLPNPAAVRHWLEQFVTALEARVAS
jgi:trehalose 6-phosphate phosphatase